jgi:hypothetical protein
MGKQRKRKADVRKRIRDRIRRENGAEFRRY